MSRTILLTVSILYATSLYSANRPPDMPERESPKKGYETSREKIYYGKVVSMSKKPLADNGSDKSDFEYVLIKTTRGEIIDCALGPHWYLRDYLKLQKDENLIVTGMPSSDSSVILVRIIKTKNELIKFRDPNGMPLWENSWGGSGDGDRKQGGGPGGGKGPGGQGGGR